MRGNIIFDSHSFESTTLPALLVLSCSILRRIFLIENAGHVLLSSSSPWNKAISESLEENEELFIVRRILHRLHLVSGGMGAVFHIYDLRLSSERRT